eukprot:CAMPEP_0194303162 /NCGR_PEP_ID=MMETSP0171-20130528/1093_1 /TAXON_ID=218684 /ORGANISM="Corethron pennatum, Strain L29A3" /LENGTH=169 /DNA_ID=CAMNT_0039053961 /DNA_START=93 /DNA_END=601 /DNA_ORIENTATION=-
MTSPNTTCFPSNQEVTTVVTKNCDPLVFGPAFAMLKKKRLSVPELKVLILKLRAINRFTAASITGGKVPALNHELGDNSVKPRIFEVKGLSRLPSTLLPGTKSSEIFGRLWYNISEQTEHNTLGIATTYGDIEEYLMSDRRQGSRSGRNRCDKARDKEEYSFHFDGDRR